MDVVEQLREKVRGFLAEIVGAEAVGVDAQGSFSFQCGSTQVFVRVGEDHSRTFVTVEAPVIIEAEPTEALYKYVATNNRYRFGHFKAFEHDGACSISFAHTLLGDYLDSEELKSAVAAVALIADRVDDELQDLFGGRRYHE